MSVSVASLPDPIEPDWWDDRRVHLDAGLGFVSYRSPKPPLQGRIPDFEIASLGDDLPEIGNRNSALVLPHLTPERLADRSFVKLAGSMAAEAARRRIAVIAATSLGEHEFAATSGTSEAEPWDLDLDALVGGTDLVFVLESRCLARVSGNDAAYLTPIEARLARGLTESRIPYQRQRFIGHLCVDFLVGEALVVECDGIRYHDPAVDRKRDGELEARGYTVLRLPGRLIHADTATAVAQVKSRLDGFVTPLFQLPANFTEPQKAAASHLGGPARVSAPAGSGKTSVIEQRVKGLIAKGVDPSRLCAISFTNRAVEEMQRRLAGAAAAGTRFTTIHKLAKEISEHGPQGRKRRPIQGVRSSRSPTRWTVLSSLLDDSERFWRDRELWPDALTTYRQSFAIPDLSDFPAAKRPSPERLVELHSAYDAELNQRGLTDYEGYILNAVRSLARSSEYRQTWNAKYDYWIVDEYQDLPSSKLGLLRLLASPQDNLFVVGDDDQIIYGFAGASIRSFADFSSVYPGASDYVLDKNFRCDHEIVVRSSWLIDRNNERIAKNIRPYKQLGDLDAVTIGDPANYDKEALRFVQSELKRGIPPDEIALLFRLKDFASPVELQLERAGIPYVPCSYASFFEKKVVTNIRAWLRLATDSASPQDVRATLKWPKRYLNAGQLDLAVQSLDGTTISRAEASEAALIAARAQDEGVKRHALEEWCAFLARAPESSPPAAILNALNLRSVADELDADAGDAPAAVLFDVFARLAAEFDTVANLERWIAARGNDRDYSFDGPETSAAARAQAGRVLLTSIHQVKGQEFTAVGVLSPPDGMPDRRAVTLAQKEEERRIAYVAITRAETSLLFAASTEYANELSVSRQGETWAAYRSRPSPGVQG